jgi:hypothetical protein
MDLDKETVYVTYVWSIDTDDGSDCEGTFTNNAAAAEKPRVTSTLGAAYEEIITVSALYVRCVTDVSRSEYALL